MKKQKKIKVLIAGPTPPPYSGQEMMTKWILKSALSEEFDFVHLDISNKRGNIQRGGFDLVNISMTLSQALKLTFFLIYYRPRVANIPMARNTFGFFKSGLFTLISSFLGVKVVSRLGGENFDIFFRASNIWMQWFIRIVLNRVAIVIVRAERLKPQFSGLIPDEKLEAVYIAMDASEFDNLKSRYKTSETRDAGLRVLFVGHISKAKGALDVLMAIPKIIPEVPNIKFIFIGDIFKKERNIIHIQNPPDIKKEVKRIISLHNIESYVEFYNNFNTKKMIESYHKADIFILPSYSEGFPFTVLEAMAAGLPVVASPVGALPEVFEQEKNILFVKPSFIDGIAREVIRLSKDINLRKRMAENNLTTVREKFNLNIYANRMKDVFYKAVGI